MMRNSNSNSDSRLLKTYMPAAALLIVTVTVMLYFKNSQESGYNIFDHGGSLLERFYAKNLKPVFNSKKELSNEDLINFAFNNNLPVSDEKVLFIGNNPELGKELGVKDAILNKNTTNYEKFVNLYCQSDESRARVDSILDFYRSDLSTSILVSENDAIVVDETILDLNKALKAELLACARKSVFGAGYNVAGMSKPHRKELPFTRDKNEDTKLVFLTPDTVFTRDYRLDKERVAQMQTVEEPEVSEEPFIVPVKMDRLAEVNEIKEFTIGKKKISAFFDAEQSDDFSLRDSLLNIKEVVNEALGKTKIGKLKIGFENGENQVDFELNFDELGEFIFQTINAVGEHSAENWEQFGLKMDSAATRYERNVLDSLIKLSMKKEKVNEKKKIRKKNK